MDPSYLDCLVSFATVCCWWVLSRALDLPWFGDLIRYPINSPFVYSEFTNWGSKFDKITFCSAFKVFGLGHLVCFENIWSTHLVYSGFPCACSRTSKGNFLFSFRILKTFWFLFCLSFKYLSLLSFGLLSSDTHQMLNSAYFGCFSHDFVKSLAYEFFESSMVKTLKTRDNCSLSLQSVKEPRRKP